MYSSIRRCLSSSSSSAWKNRHVRDKYTKLSHNNDLRARSYYKLDDILRQNKGLVRPGDFVIDLGAAPGGWSLCIADILYPNSNNNNSSNGSLLIGLDLLPIDAIYGAVLIQGDFTKETTRNEINTISGNRQANAILSDMLQNVTGIHSTDHLRSIDLCFDVLHFAKSNLISNGNVLCKFLRGSDDNELLKEARGMFEKVKIIKPAASRMESSEIYLLCMKKK